MYGLQGAEVTGLLIKLH